MKLLFDQIQIKKYFNSIKGLIYIFLLWNSFKLFQIKADPIIQLLSTLLSIGIYFDIEDKNSVLDISKLNLRRKININLLLSLLIFLMICIRSFFLNEITDKFYYLLLPLGILSISFIGRSFNAVLSFRNIIIISFLLPIRRLFFYIFNPIMLFITKYFTYFFLFVLGTDPNLEGRSIFIGGSELVISEGCAGTDNLYFVISAVIIYKIIFSLKRYKNILFMYFATLIIPILTNMVRNTLLALIITLNINIRDKIFNFFHDSYGSLIFSLISISIISCLYFKLLDKELNYK